MQQSQVVGQQAARGTQQPEAARWRSIAYLPGAHHPSTQHPAGTAPADVHVKRSPGSAGAVQTAFCLWKPKSQRRVRARATGVKFESRLQPPLFAGEKRGAPRGGTHAHAASSNRNSGDRRGRAVSQVAQTHPAIHYVKTK